MKIIVTGSLGHIGKPLTEELVQKGHDVTVISSIADRRQEIENIGANPAIGSLEDVAFLTGVFKGADAVYAMVPPNNYFDHDLDLLAYYIRLGKNYLQAIEASGVKRVVNLSSIGAHLEKGSGILSGAHNVERTLNALPKDVNLTHIRPTSFYYNLYGYAESIKRNGVITANYGTENFVPWVSPIDIAEAVAQELTTPFEGRNVRYVCSEELTGNQVAGILGEAIGIPKLRWVLTSDEDILNELVTIGMNPRISAGLVEMYSALQSGLLSEDYIRNRPVLGRIKMTDFAKEFAVAFKQI